MWEEREEAPLFAFLEGPPTANGFMHVGHARGRTLKDVKLRFYRMKGYRVWDQAGWDTQGLPVELEVEKKLGFRSKRDIESYGVERFIEECQKLVDYYLEHWEAASKRLGLWLDYAHAYQTRHPRYLDSLWSFLKEMWRKGLLYEDLRVVPRCPRCHTALSSHEVAQGYEEVEDPSVYFKAELLDEPGTYLVAWTTTPWTIIANEAMVVHPEETYLVLSVGGEKWILAEKRLQDFLRETGLQDYEVVGRLKGGELEGRKYRHPLQHLVEYHASCEPPHHQVFTAEWVTMEEGTGVVHAAPAHGPEDFELAKEKGLRVYTPLQENGYFSQDAGPYSGAWFQEAAKRVVRDLEEAGLLIHAGTVRHNYPFCWRCGTPLIYYSSRQWFLSVYKLKDKMLEELSRHVSWRPGWAHSRMADWVENAKDWCISRERFWGTPLPIWTCTSCRHRVVVGSLDELRSLAKNPEEVKDHHRPWVDRVVLQCPKCGGEMRREPFVVDVWMDSGVAHTAALHQYGWDSLRGTLYPYTWITEAADQTRGWFYTLLATGVLWHGRVPYRAVLLQGHVLDKYGRKMSKSKGNVVWAYEWMEKHGADPMRVFLLSRTPWDSINFDPDEIDRYRSYLNILWNSAKFAAMYMSIDKWRPSPPRPEELEPEDRWILYELHEALKRIEEAVEKDNMHQAVTALSDFIVEKLSHKYITVVRPRVWEEEMTPSKNAAYATLHYVLVRTIKMLAPFAPFLAEYLHQAYTRSMEPGKAEETVHLEEWPSVDPELLDEDAWRAVEAAFTLADQVLSARSEAGIKRRWPLRLAVLEPTGELPGELLEKAGTVLARYANIKEVRVGSRPGDGFKMLEAPGVRAYVKLEIDEELLLEGLAREVIRRAQTMRKRMNLDIDAVLDKLEVYTESEKLRAAVEKHRDYIASEVRVRVVVLADKPGPGSVKWSVEGEEIHLRLE